MKNKEQKLKYIDFLKKGKKTKQPKVDSSYGEEYKYPVTHMNELVVTPNGTELGSVTSDAMLDNLVNTYMQRQVKDKKDLSNMVRHIHSGTETAAKWLTPLVTAPVAATLPWGTVGRGAAKGLEFLGKAMTPSSYSGLFGSGVYTTPLGGTNASLLGTLADTGLASYYGSGIYNAIKDKPTLQNVTEAALMGVPVVGSAVQAEKSSISVAKLLYKLQKGTLTENELKALGAPQKDIQWLMKNYETLRYSTGGNRNKLNAVFERIVAKANGVKGARSREAIRAAEIEEIPTNPAARRKYFEKKANAIREQYIDQIEENSERTGLDWDDMYQIGMGAMSAMSPEVKMSPVRFDKKTPFLKRYYDNVLEVIKPGGFQDQILESGLLRKNSQNQWEGLVEGKYVKVNPVDYVKTQLAKSKGMDVELPSRGITKSINKLGDEVIGYNYPMHGTRVEMPTYLTNPNKFPGKKGYWTIIADTDASTSDLPGFFKGGRHGVSVPFFRLPKYEGEIMRHQGIGSSNSWNGTGKSLRDIMGERKREILRPVNVSDTHAPGAVNEYDFGPDVPDAKSLWNTLDFQSGAGPLAFISNQKNYNLA